MTDQKKKCTKCSEVKSLDEFYARKLSADGKTHRCKKCGDAYDYKRKRTKDGLIAKMRSSQRRSSDLRGHPPPSYSLNQLKEWAFSQELFHKLHAEWVASGYDKMKFPSIDRKDDYKGYSFDNIQLMTWEENKKKYYKDRISGVNNKANKPVSQYTKDGVFINTFHSGSEAERATGIRRTNISACCLGKEKSAGGFIWKRQSE